MSKQNAKIRNLQGKIDKLDQDFKKKMVESNRLSEKLKIALENMNSVKEQNLAEIRKGNIEYQSLIKQQIELKQKIELLNHNLMQMKEKTKFLRAEYVTKFGIRHAQLIFS